MNPIRQLERWVWFGGMMLAMIAGMVNAVAFLSFSRHGHVVSHLTGTTTELGVAIADGHMPDIRHLALVLGAFVSGCMLSGFIIQHNKLKIGQRYGVALAMESALLYLTACLMEKSHSNPIPEWAGIYTAACAMGLQNAMATTYSGALLRTTHVTGMFTDMAVALGHWMRRIPVDRLRIKFCFLITGAFLFGGILTGLLFKHLQYATLYIPAALTGGVGILYITYSHWRLQKERIERHIRQTARWISGTKRKKENASGLEEEKSQE